MTCTKKGTFGPLKTLGGGGHVPPVVPTPLDGHKEH